VELITTLPPIYQRELLEEVVEHPLVSDVRYNTGMNCDIPAEDILTEIVRFTEKYKKNLYLDLKGRQLRITEWSSPPYGPICLNHKIDVELPAKVFFRGDSAGTIRMITNGNQIYVDPPPKYAVGAGQSVNIVSPSLKILDGYFLERDLEFIRAAKRFGIRRFFFSFSEFEEDIALFNSAISEIEKPKKLLKIESQNGVDLVRKLKKIPRDLNLMTARDDLVIHVGVIGAGKASSDIIRKDRRAICASRLMMGLESGGEVTLADMNDIEMMRSIGYDRFLLSDGISNRHFRKAMNFWTEYIRGTEK
jgi:hypothetical protein